MNNNRFAVLMSEDEEAGDSKKSVYVLISGSQDIDRMYNNTIANTTNDPNITFFGSCFDCKYRSHSLKFCPLRRCATCGQFGHSETVCSTKMSQ